jgi:signal transduction histidine kinase
MRLKLASAAPGVRVHLDTDRFLQVMTNLLSNAAKFSPEGGQVEVLVERKNNKIRVSVVDHGPGIPEKFRGRIFEKFAQADPGSKGQWIGTGLGLSICKAIIERLGGTIDFTTETNVGTTFYFELDEAPAGLPTPAPRQGQEADA